MRERVAALLVHGTGSYADVWSPVLDGLARSYRVIAYDRRGFERSSPAPDGGLVEHARDDAALLDALGASPATVVGWSGGNFRASFPSFAWHRSNGNSALTQ